MSEPTLDNPGKVVTRPAKLAHVVLRTNDFQRLSSFYQMFLSADVNFENEFMKLLSYDSEHHRIGIVNVDGIGPKNTQTNGLEHIAFTYSSLTDLAMAYLQRKANGVLPFWCINHGPTTSVYYHDPDGNILETQVDNFDTVAEAAEYMTSEAYQVNPLGVDFDMEDMVERLRAGEDERSIKKRPESGPRGLDTVPARRTPVAKARTETRICESKVVDHFPLPYILSAIGESGLESNGEAITAMGRSRPKMMEISRRTYQMLPSSL